MKLYLDITTSLSLALSTGVFVISLMQLVNGAQVLNTTCTLLFPLPAANAATVIVLFMITAIT